MSGEVNLYHPESDSYLTMDADEYFNGVDKDPDLALCVVIDNADPQKPAIKRSNKMSTDLIIPNAADLAAHIKALTKDAARAFNEDAAAGISTGAPPRVKLNGKQFVMVDGNGKETPFPPAQLVPTPDGNVGMPIIILRAKKAFTKQWFAGAYNPSVEAQAPDKHAIYEGNARRVYPRWKPKTN